MKSSSRAMLVGLCVLALGGCSSAPLYCEDGRPVRWFSNPLTDALENGIKRYEDGNYAASIPLLQGVVESPNASNSLKLEAYKYLAFSYCLSPKDEKKMCRESFKKAIEIEPKFELLPAEAGHPVWGPVFKSVKNKPAK
ncbi:MAG: TssQ family T6SS-associated lipoprotein [Gallionellaceae bacterium]